MDRRTFLSLLSTPAVIALLNACGSDDESSDTSSPDSTSPGTTSPDTTTPPQSGEARSDLARAAAPASAAGDAASSFNAFGGLLYRSLATNDPTGNLVVSPASIALALTMTMTGARGETLQQMADTLQIADPETIHHSVNALTAALDTRNSAADDVEVSLANSLWGQIGLAFEQAFLDLLATEYGAGLDLVDYTTDPEAARAVINGWVEDETHGRIPELLPQGVITADTRLTLVNAIYMKAQWLEQFTPELTAPIPFTGADGTTSDVPAMVDLRSMPYTSGAGWQAVELPYVGEELAMLVIVPDKGALSSTEESLDVAAVAGALAPQQIRLTLPRFDIESSLSVGDAVKALGMELAFSDDADFSGITIEEALKISAVIHQANITVDEYGTEAAAATAVVMETTSAPVDEPVDLVVDRPFLFAVRDIPTGLVLFAGRVASPA